MQTLWIGIDVAKSSLQTCALFSDSNQKERCFANIAKGRSELRRWIQTISQGCEAKVFLESTGSYGNALAAELCEQGIWVSVLNPRTVKHYAISLGSRNKNDQVDARIIAQYGKERDPKRWSLADPIRREICQILNHIERLRKSIRIHENPLEDEGLADSVRESCQNLIEALKQECKLAQLQIQRLIESDPKLSGIVEAVEQIKGVGKTTAIQFVARLDVDAFERAEDAAAFAGLNPCQRQSGKSLNRTVLSKQGDAALRTAFYFPAIVASKYLPSVKALRERLSAKNKRWNAIRAACMRKLLMICFGVAKRASQGRKPFYNA